MRRLISTTALTMGAALIASSAAMAQGTLYFGINNEPGSFNPFVNEGTAARTVELGIHRGLVNYAPDGSLSLELAESYEQTDDALTFTFHLRDAKFHDGSPVTANDVKATIERIKDPNASASFRNEISIIDTVEVIDDKTVRFVLARPSVSLIHYLALPESAILPAAWIEAYAADQSIPLVGAGPFKFVRWERGREVIVERFEDFYKDGKPHLDEVHYVFYNDDNTRVNAILGGDVDIIDYVPAKDTAMLDEHADIRVETTYGPFMGLTFNTSFEPFSKPEVRRAIAHAIDRDVIINTAFAGLGEPLRGLPLREGDLGYKAEHAEHYDHDLEKARQLLAEAGYPDGFEARLLAASNPDFHRDTAIAVQAELAKIGIKVNLDLPTWAARMTKAYAGDYDFTVLGSVGEITDSDWLTNYFYGGEQLVRTNNSPYFEDETVNELLDAARATTDQAERAVLYDQLADRLVELTPIVFFMWRQQDYAVRENVQGFTNMPGFLSFQSGLSVENVTIE